MENNLIHWKLCDSINMEITAKYKTATKPQSLPPTERATYYHSLRVHLQVIQWKTLMTTDADPLGWG